MSGTRCAVFGCSNTYDANKGREDDKKITMHAFPKSKDLRSQTIRNEWISRCSRTDKFNPDTSRICSEHFTGTDYDRDLKHELLGIPLRKLLKKTAIPTIRVIEKKTDKSKSIRSDDEGIAKRRKKEVVTDLITEGVFEENQEQPKLKEGVSKTNPILIENAPEPCVETVTNIILKDSNSHVEQYEDFDNDEVSRSSFISSRASEKSKDYEEKYTKLLKAHNNLKLKYWQMQRNVKKKIKILNNQVRYFKAKSLNNTK